MILASTSARIDGYQIVGYKGAAQGATFEDLLNNTKTLGANAVLNVCYDNALSTDTLFHGSAVVIEPVRVPVFRKQGEQASFAPASPSKPTGESLRTGNWRNTIGFGG